jgi:hypothetical protein
MQDTWNVLSDDLQRLLSEGALSRASASIARHAEMMANEMESGEIPERSGPDALRLLAALARMNAQSSLQQAGNA